MKSNILSEKDIEKVGKLSRLKLTPEEKELYLKQLSSILEFMEQLKELNTEEVLPTFYPLDLKSVWRKDCVTSSLSQEEALDNAPAKERGYFKVPRIIE
ncbi:MAG: Asp-tRNA(Asn)/Glu-tRNA(Gln) amidotransferase subunit GatC [Caldiserica bacterium]|nr:Asp-tRNA(Asn)/Glu-tRNA(Gln) amidotransferase subunit GatC [Caldisericota bacterium]